MNPMPTIVTASAAARLCNVGRKTILRRLAAGKIPGAEQALDGVWRIPVSGLRAAGLDPQAGLRSTPSLAQLQIELAE
ncbi:helix-turn-helix domain-containing protein, partial [Escherichia coli]|uniref:helix-turn-helix domain-containing protein n=1 Tax=Escherichia coli TaxID=562 RepID=UPI003D81B310